jgi:citrate synthase
MYHGEDFRIMRPRQIYTGKTIRHYVERAARK